MHLFVFAVLIMRLIMVIGFFIIHIFLQYKNEGIANSLFIYLQYPLTYGDGGIRTHVTLRSKRFRVVLVMASSIRLQINLYKSFTFHQIYQEYEKD
jgi:hypothetical protein